MLGPPKQCNSVSSSVAMPGNRPWHVSFHRHNTSLPPVSVLIFLSSKGMNPAKAVSSSKRLSV